jgi:hypothetical protein
LCGTILPPVLVALEVGLVVAAWPVFAVFVHRNVDGDVVVSQDDADGKTHRITVPRTEAANMARAIKEAAKGE